MVTGRALGQLAFVHVSQVKNLADRKAQERYLTVARRLPAMLQKNGLGQTLAFLYAKAQGRLRVGAEGQLLTHLEAMMRAQLDTQGPADIMQWVLVMSVDDYRVASQHAMTASGWLKRFAEGMLAAEES